MRNKICPNCCSDNIAPLEHEYKTEYPFWMVFVAGFFFLAVLFLLFFLLQLHPIIIILVAIAVVSKLLSLKRGRKKTTKKIEYICLDCDHRFTVKEIKGV
ncbi:MAG: hypothetical protein U9O50_04480 [Acidobacteriota bacterium]|nr:hypothetical protein [Acidobacteriota bacterium]